MEIKELEILNKLAAEINSLHESISTLEHFGHSPETIKVNGYTVPLYELSRETKDSIVTSTLSILKDSRDKLQKEFDSYILTKEKT